MNAGQVWGEPSAHWSTNRTLGAVGIAVALAAAGAAVIYAANTGGAAAGPGFGPPGGPPGAGPGFGGPGGPGSRDADLPTALHGQFVVSDGKGTFTTQLTQTGTVTDISDTSITARSEDGFTQTYVINTETRQSRDGVRTGQTATIRAVTQNGSNTATAISAQR
ncbi:hypothetical protein [Mycolicibacterium confluentis]|uniref:Uncharacterized protein n=1 Tax=Mycolicibacterium confluentis TaxID=28047 RepID=A0A7I7Y538_9MYCO|nr:hypothetical protein [Mycolicibacterium confluentis]MCV7319117.1 hypothetical protein [Mycolicibacterium confluentis]ORV24838.1 hypothetical protein AWB99_04925 [Mycolicibacterium confluentis]BBZ36730.1 hypothetical protein MCNF_53350 [Mycolicibacterium confluentis]